MVILVFCLYQGKVVIPSKSVPLRERILYIFLVEGWFEWVEFMVVVMMRLLEVKVLFQVKAPSVFL